MGLIRRRIGALLLTILTLGLTLPRGNAVPITAKENGSPKRIALTFDDGPSTRYTGEILDILKEYGVKATFFTVGVNIEKAPDLLRRIVSEGHEIGNHTYSHPHLQKMDAATLAEELARTDALIRRVAGVSPTLFRPPEGVVTTSVKAAAQGGGYRLVLWSIDTRDWALNPVSDILQTVKREASDGDIILFHDWVAGRSPTPDALRQVIPWLIAEGYEFVTVGQLMQ
ncbi:MAG: polysaccharide deacetylase family protein [Clostridia bacterium]|nr:polysaccharide deacetylase family protein [Clostridia bacterium]